MDLNQLFKIEQAGNERLRLMTYGLAILAAGLMLPALLIFFIRFTGYSEVFEETVKAVVVVLLITRLPNLKLQIIAAVIFGFLFGLSENLLYLGQILEFGDPGIMVKRFLLPLPMHVATVLILLFSALAGRRLVVFGLLAAVFVHLFFNSIVAG